MIYFKWLYKYKYEYENKSQSVLCYSLCTFLFIFLFRHIFEIFSAFILILKFCFASVIFKYAYVILVLSFS